ETVSDAPTPENAAWNSQIASGLDHCLSQLDPSKASYVRLAYLEGWSYEELARASGTPVNTMKTWLRRSLLRLRDCLAGLGMRHD
ncbi:sigma factor-like helix-turn-helix DNA-binding protein, partial [Paracoccus sp. (in: a-proteobacteria)]|uniref:sigma factor-like helix-turn-helix DNA-binding protein n=1 Tax=Paracoccus sp. TaxID=267 RepID=UPI00272D7E16